MKKIFLLIALAIGFIVPASAGDSYSRDPNVLPKAALVTLQNNFNAKVNLIKLDKTFGITTEYEVILADGTEISFDRSGNWQNVEVGQSKSVPSGFILKGISDYVKKNHPKTKIVGIERDGNNFDIELSDGIEMQFSSEGKFMRYED